VLPRPSDSQYEAVAAERRLAAARARVRVVAVAVVAELHAREHVTVAAERRLAAARARVRVVEVAVVAPFHAHPGEAVAARGRLAAARAGIDVIEVAVVAPLDPSPHQAVTAHRRLTGARARVGVVEVAVIAVLARLGQAVAAGATATGRHRGPLHEVAGQHRVVGDDDPVVGEQVVIAQHQHATAVAEPGVGLEHDHEGIAVVGGSQLERIGPKGEGRVGHLIDADHPGRQRVHGRGRGRRGHDLDPPRDPERRGERLVERQRKDITGDHQRPAGRDPILQRRLLGTTQHGSSGIEQRRVEHVDPGEVDRRERTDGGRERVAVGGDDPPQRVVVDPGGEHTTRVVDAGPVEAAPHRGVGGGRGDQERRDREEQGATR
jgi:hypothetical protein